MRQNTNTSNAHKRLQVLFGSEVGFRFARMARGVITHGQYFKKGDPHVEMTQQTFDKLMELGLVSESKGEAGCYFVA